MTFLRRVPLPVAVGVLAALTLLGVVGLDRLGWGRWSLLAIVVAGAFAVVYLVEYNKDAPVPTPRAAPTPEAQQAEADDEPFDDPVAEAARLDQARAHEALTNAAHAPENLTDPSSGGKLPPPPPEPADDPGPDAPT